jgi:hypothetical protein
MGLNTATAVITHTPSVMMDAHPARNVNRT